LWGRLRQAAKPLALGIGLLIVVGCGASQGASSEEITVGALVPTSGAFAEIGTDTKRGFELYAKQHNSELGGIPYNLVEGNEATEEPAETVRSAQRLIQEDRADVVFGVISSASALALRDVFDGQQTPLIITNANVTEVSCENASPYVFRASYTFNQAGLIEGRWIAENVAKDGVYIIAPDYAGGRDLLAAFKRGFVEGGGSEDGIVGEAYPPFQQTDDYQPYLTEIKNSGAEHVFAFFGGAEAVTFLKQYEGFGLGDIPLYGHGALADESILPALDRSVVGVTTFAPYSATLENPQNEEFRRAYRQEYDEEPTYFAAGAYIAAEMVSRAIEESGGELPEDEEAFAEALAEVGSFPAPLGEFRLVPETRNPVATFYVREVSNEGDALVNEVLGEAGTVEEACPS
jgi:branched-chain amino acid transport system substrate-binding protein